MTLLAFPKARGKAAFCAKVASRALGLYHYNKRVLVAVCGD